MSNWIDIYRVLWKQYFIRFRIWIIFLLFGSIAVGIVSRMNLLDEEYQGISIGVCAADEKGRELFGKLQEEKGIFRFQGYSDEQEMLRQVENGTLECGYVFPEGFYDNLLMGKTARQIILYYSPASSAHKISYEVVFADLFEILSEDILKEYLKENGYYGEELKKAQERLLALNIQYAGDGSTFQFVYETAENQVNEKPENLNILRGCISVMIFLMCLLGLGNSLEQKNTWKAIPGNKGRRLKSGSIHVAICGSVLIGGICLWLSRTGDNLLKETEGLLLYFVMLEIYIRVISLFIKSRRVLYGLLPVMLLCCCLFCPVFISIDRYLPGAEWISGLFPVTYYLKLFLT